MKPRELLRAGVKEARWYPSKTSWQALFTAPSIRELLRLAESAEAVRSIVTRDALWGRFLAWERNAAKDGSGMTRDQMTGATMFEMWLWEQPELRDALAQPTEDAR